jgi:signal transduction histidine kinase
MSIDASHSGEGGQIFLRKPLYLKLEEKMKSKKLVMFLAVALLTLTAVSALAQEKATPEEVYAKVREAAAYLAEKGDAALDEFNNPEGAWVWKDTYIFVYDCDEGICVANPNNRSLPGTKIEDIVDINGKPVGINLCEASKKPNGWWIDYMWKVVGSDDQKMKISYIYKAAGAKYTVGAGIYGPEGITVDDLNKELK